MASFGRGFATTLIQLKGCELCTHENSVRVARPNDEIGYRFRLGWFRWRRAQDHNRAFRLAPCRRSRKAEHISWESPQLSPAVDGRAIIQKHGMVVAALLALELNRDDLARLGVIGEVRGVRHADELIFDKRLIEGERLRNNRLECRRISPVGDDQILAINETIRPRRKGLGWSAA